MRHVALAVAWLLVLCACLPRDAQTVYGVGGAQVIVPAGALPAGLAVSILLGQPPRHAPAHQGVSALYLIGPSGVRFEKPVTVTLPYDPARIGFGRVRLYTAPEGSARWTALETVVDPVRATASAQVAHFSQFQAGVAPGAQCPDADGDGHHPIECGGLDCNDGNPRIHAGAPEWCDALDNDCDGVADERCRALPAGATP